MSGLPAEMPASTLATGAKTVCPYCGVGCGLRVEVEDGRIARIRGDETNQGTQGKLCRKAVYLPQAIHAPDRLTRPRIQRCGGVSREVSWNEAMSLAAQRLQTIIAKHGPDSVAFYISGQLLTEDYYVVNKLAKGFLGTNNLDSNSRLCMSSAVVAYQLAFGEDGPPCTYADLDEANCFLFVGSNAADCHPVLFQRAMRRKQADPDNVTVIVIDPRRTATARGADIHLRPRPGTDVPLLQGLLHVLIRDGLVNAAFVDQHTSGDPAVWSAAAEWTPQRTSDATGVPAADIERAAQAFGRAGAALSFWAMGLSQSVAGVDASLALINLHLATGQVGRPGAGPFSLTGQPNAMGGREVGGLAALLPGHRLVTNPGHRQQMERLWSLPEGSIAPKPGLTAVELFSALADGSVKAVWIAGTNPMVSMPDTQMVRAGLERAELVVVQDAYYPTETMEMAHIALPAAQWGEKEGTSTSSERRVSYMPALVSPPGEARPDWAIFADLGRRLGYGDAFDFSSAEEVFAEYRTCTAETSVTVTGLSYARLQREGGIQWPCPTEASQGTPRLYTDLHFATPDGRAQFHVPVWRQPEDQVSSDLPFVLTSGRERDQWHTMTRTGNVPQLLKACPEPYLAVHPRDAERLGVGEQDWVEIARPGRGRVRLQARLTDDVPEGTVFAPFHWGGLRHPGGPVNAATSPAVSPTSKQPGLKYATVHLRAVPRLALSWEPEKEKIVA